MRKKEEPIGYIGKRLTHRLYLSELTLLSIWQTKERNLVQWWRSQNSWRPARLTCSRTSNPRFSFFNYIELGNSSPLYYRFMLLLTNCFIKTWKEATFGLCATQEFKTLYPLRELETALFFFSFFFFCGFGTVTIVLSISSYSWLELVIVEIVIWPCFGGIMVFYHCWNSR